MFYFKNINVGAIHSGRVKCFTIHIVILILLTYSKIFKNLMRTYNRYSALCALIYLIPQQTWIAGI